MFFLEQVRMFTFTTSHVEGIMSIFVVLILLSIKLGVFDPRPKQVFSRPYYSPD